MNTTRPLLPSPLLRLMERLPAYPPALAFTRGLNALVWPALKAHGSAELAGRRYCIHVRDLGLRLYFSLGPRGFTALSSGPADLTLRADSRDFLALALRQEDADALFFSRRLVTEGDTELGLLVKNTLDALDLPERIARLPLPGVKRLLARLGAQAAAR